MATMIVETGAKEPKANSYCDLAFANDYHELLGNTDWSGDDDTLESALIKATWSIDLLYGQFYESARAMKPQSLLWPRITFVDKNNTIQYGNTIPIELKRATAALALKLMLGEVEAVQELSTTGNIRSQSTTVDAITVDVEYYEQQKASKYDGNTEVELLLRPLLKSKKSSVSLVR